MELYKLLLHITAKLWLRNRQQYWFLESLSCKTLWINIYLKVAKSLGMLILTECHLFLIKSTELQWSKGLGSSYCGYSPVLWTTAEICNPLLILSGILFFVTWLVLFPISESGTTPMQIGEYSAWSPVSSTSLARFPHASEWMEITELRTSTNHLPETVPIISLLWAGRLIKGAERPGGLFFNFTIVTWAIGGKILSLG